MVEKTDRSNLSSLDIAETLSRTFSDVVPVSRSMPTLEKSYPYTERVEIVMSNNKNDVYAVSLPSTELLTCSPLSRHFREWEYELRGDLERSFILDGLLYGFKLVADLQIVKPADCENYSSAVNADAKPFLDEIFLEELHCEKISSQREKPIRIHSIGAVLMKDSAIPRPITDCSRPSCDSLNSYVNSESFSFQSIDDAIELSQPCCCFGIVDIKSAFRQVPVFPPHRQLQGFRWNFNGTNEYFVDNCPCFGLSCGPRIFHKISSAIARMLVKRRVRVVPYLDDFLIVGETRDECLQSQQILLTLLGTLGFPVNWKKVIHPTQRIQFLGLILDSRSQTIELPEAKTCDIIERCTEFSHAVRISKKELQRLVGVFCFASRAIRGARTFS